MKKLGILMFVIVVLLMGITLGIAYMVNPYKVKRLLGLVRPNTSSNVFVDCLKGTPFTTTVYDGIDVSKHNGIIKWGVVAKNKKVKFVYVKATEGYGYTDRLYRRNFRNARKAGLKVGSYHFLTSQSSVSAQFLHFSKVVRRMSKT